MSAVDTAIARAEDEVNQVRILEAATRARMRPDTWATVHRYSAELLEAAEQLHETLQGISAHEQRADLESQNQSEDTIREELVAAGLKEADRHAA